MKHIHIKLNAAGGDPKLGEAVLKRGKGPDQAFLDREANAVVAFQNIRSGVLRTVRKGNMDTVVVHPHEWDAIAELRPGEWVLFREETGRMVKATYHSDGMVVFLTRGGRPVIARRSDMVRG